MFCNVFLHMFPICIVKRLQQEPEQEPEQEPGGSSRKRRRLEQKMREDLEANEGFRLEQEMLEEEPPGRRKRQAADMDEDSDMEKEEKKKLMELSVADVLGLGRGPVKEDEDFDFDSCSTSTEHSVEYQDHAGRMRLKVAKNCAPAAPRFWRIERWMMLQHDKHAWTEYLAAADSDSVFAKPDSNSDSDSKDLEANEGFRLEQGGSLWSTSSQG